MLPNQEESSLSLEFWLLGFPATVTAISDTEWRKEKKKKSWISSLSMRRLFLSQNYSYFLELSVCISVNFWFSSCFVFRAEDSRMRKTGKFINLVALQILVFLSIYLLLFTFHSPQICIPYILSMFYSYTQYM